MARDAKEGRGKARSIAAIVVALLVIAIVAVGAFVSSRTVHENRRAVAPSPSPSTTSAPTPSAVLAATNAPTLPAVTTAAVPVAARVGSQLAPGLVSSALGPSVHALVTDAATGAVLFDRQSTVASAPASTNKLATAAAVLSTMPATTRFSTRAVAGASPGQVVLVGGGDPTLSAAAAGQSSIYAGAARLSDLAAQIHRALGAQPVTQIVVDTSLFTGAREAPGWAAEDVPSNYESAITALMVDGGRPADGSEIRSDNPELEAGRALASELGVPSATVVIGTASAGSRQLGVVQSAPALELIEQMLANSDNVIAELLGRQVAIRTGQPASFAGTTAGIRTALARVGITLSATLVDASGLSGQDRLTPTILVSVLRAALSGAHPELGPLITALPVAGWDGTLTNRYRLGSSSTAAGQVRAKTGTLDGVSTLAGTVLDTSGRLLVFAVMADQVPSGGFVAAEAALDVAVARLAACGCS